jgi:hypothetical protein
VGRKVLRMKEREAVGRESWSAEKAPTKGATTASAGLLSCTLYKCAARMLTVSKERQNTQRGCGYKGWGCDWQRPLAVQRDSCSKSHHSILQHASRARSANTCIPSHTVLAIPTTGCAPSPHTPAQVYLHNSLVSQPL